jgi:hypothetical protein
MLLEVCQQWRLWRRATAVESQHAMGGPWSRDLDLYRDSHARRWLFDQSGGKTDGNMTGHRCHVKDEKVQTNVQELLTLSECVCACVSACVWIVDLVRYARRTSAQVCRSTRSQN